MKKISQIIIIIKVIDMSKMENLKRKTESLKKRQLYKSENWGACGVMVIVVGNGDGSTVQCVNHYTMRPHPAQMEM